MTLHIGPELDLDDNIVTETIAILAKRGGGKSNAAVVLAEQMTDNGLQWVTIDPKGDWWGVRSAADGKHPGLPVPVFGGAHGDVPLESTAGALMAQLVIDRDLTAVLDVSGFSKTEQIRFVTDFAETLFKLIRTNPRAMHLFLEEAEEFLPQRVEARSARMVGAYSKISKQGRTFGLGVTLITQRSASLNKDALSQTDTLVLFRTTSPHDRKAVVAWCDYHAEAPDVAASLAELDPGESWIVSPGFLGSITRVRWDRRRTFDSGATPTAGIRRTAPVALADIDLAEISDLMAETIERAKADDPKALRTEIARLTKALATAEATTPEPIVEFIEIPVLDEELVVRAERVIEQLSEHGRQVLEASGILVENLGTARRLVAAAPATRTPALAPAPAAPRARAAAPARQAPAQGTAEGWPNDIGKAGRKILTVLAQHGEMTVTRLALQAGYSAQGGGFRNPMGALRTAGYITGGLRGENVSLTTDGQAVIPADLPPLPTGAELIAHWVGQLPKAAALALQELADIWPDRISVDDLAARTGYEVSGGGFRNALGRLRTLELIAGGLRGEPIGVSDDLMGAP